MSDKLYLGQNAASLDRRGELSPVSRVTIWYDDENAFTAGNDGGTTLEIDCPWATQAMTDNLLAAVSGFVYRPFGARDALLDPAAELGDGVTVNGMYAVLAGMDTTLDAVCAADISAPGDQEVDHEYPYVSPQDRALKRKVSLGASYYGTKITRKEGLVIEKTDGETVSAKAVFNADELSFYDGKNVRVLYFDPATGTYKFTGVLNVSDNFLVDKDGNVTIKGDLNLSSGKLFWGDAFPLKSQFAQSRDGPWYDDQAPGDSFRRDSFDGGKTWGTPYQFVGRDGSDGQDGQDGTDADVDFYSIKRALQLANGLQSTFITADSAGAPNIYGGKIYGAEIFAGDGTAGYSKMTGNGFDVTDRYGYSKLGLALEYIGDTAYPFVTIGTGSWSGTGGGIIKKFTTGLWIGDSSALGVASSNQISGTGIFISFASNIIYKYISGVPTEIGDGGGSGGVTVTAVWGA